MAERIKGMQIVIGGDTTGLSKALSGVNKKISGTQKELKDVERLLKLDPKNTVLLEQKQKLLAEAISETREKLDSLKDADKQLSQNVKNYDKWKAAYDPIQQEIDDTKKKLNDLKQAQKDLGSPDADGYDKIQAEVKETEERLKDLQAQAKKVSDEFGNPISPKQYDALQREMIETKQELKKLEQQAKRSKDKILDVAGSVKKMADSTDKLSGKIDKLAGYTAPVSAAVAGLGTAAIASVEATEELRTDLSKLENAARDSGVSAETARQVWKDFAVATDEVDSSVEAVANLLKAGIEENKLQEAMEGITGAYLQFPDTLKIESLADSLQETLATGEAVGQFAELIERLGGSTETFNEALKNAETDSEKVEVALQYMADNGLARTYQSWKDNNEELVAYKESAMELNEQYAELAETVQPLLTEILDAVSEALEMFNNLSPEMQKNIAFWGLLVAAISPVLGALGWVLQGIKGILDFLSITFLPGVSKVTGFVFGKLKSFATLITKSVIPAIATAAKTVFSFLATKIGAFIGFVQGTVIPAIVTAVKTIFSFLVTKIGAFIGFIQGTIIPAIATAAKTVFSFLVTKITAFVGFIQGTVIPAIVTALQGLFAFLAANPVVLIIGTIVAAVIALVALIAVKGDEIQAILQKVDDFLQNVFAINWKNIFGPVLGEYLNFFVSNVKNMWNALKQIFDGIINFIRGVFTGDWERAWQGVGQIVKGIFDWMVGAVKTPLNAIIGLLNGAISAINSLINGFNSIDISLPSWLGGGSWSPSIPNIPSIPYLAKGGILQKGSAVVGEAGPELLTIMGNRAMVQPLTSQTQNTTNLGGVSVTVYGAPGQDVRELASIIMDEMESATQRKKAVYA